MIQTHTTFHGKIIPLNEIEHQHLSNIIWYNTIVLDYPVEYCREFLNELRSRYNGQLLPYRPHVDFAYEMGVLRMKGMLVLDKVDPKRIIIFGEGREVGEIQCTTIDQRHQILFPYQAQIDSELNIPKQPSVDAPMEQLIAQMKSTENEVNYTISFGALRERYKNVDKRPFLKWMFPEGVALIEKEIEKLKKEEDNAPFFAMGILLRRKNHPLNVYTIQRTPGGMVGIFNITHGQWWGNQLHYHEVKLLSTKQVTKAEFYKMCGSHNPDNFYNFKEANDLIKK